MTHVQSTSRVATALTAAALLAGGGTINATPAGAAAAPAASAKPASEAKAKTAKANAKARAKAKAKPRASQKRRAHHRRAKAASTGEAQAALDALPPYTGTTGLVLHTKSVTVNFKITDDPFEQRGYTRTAESWTELGGGERTHDKATFEDADTGEPGGSNEHWTSPLFSVATTPGWPAGLAIWCTRVDGRGSFDATVREARGDLAAQPAGPAINGRPTKVVTRNPFPGVPGLALAWQYFYDAATGKPVRSTQLRDGELQFQTDYSLWEERPAGGSAADLTVGALPSDTQLNNGDGASCI